MWIDTGGREPTQTRTSPCCRERGSDSPDSKPASVSIPDDPERSTGTPSRWSQLRLPLGVFAAVLILLHLAWAAPGFGVLDSLKTQGKGVFDSRKEGAVAVEVAEPRRPGKLGIVITHFSEDTLAETAAWWDGFLNIEMVRVLEPEVYIYCQNPGIEDLSALDPLLRHGGQMEHLDNLGRETHAFLTHIIKYYDQLQDHVLFSQDIPVDTKMWHRFQRIGNSSYLVQKMFVPETGFLPLAIVGHQDCEDGWLPKGLMPQLYAMFTKQLCPPQGFTAAYNGQFLVSRRRLRNVDWWTYKHLLELVAAPTTHWIHTTHNNVKLKQPDNPFFGHVLERAWSLAFNCYDSWREHNCYGCDHDRQMEDCGTDCCQCMDLETS